MKEANRRPWVGVVRVSPIVSGFLLFGGEGSHWE